MQNQALVLHNIYSEFTKIKFLLSIYNQGYQYFLKVALPLIGQFIIQWSNNSQYVILVIVHCFLAKSIFIRMACCQMMNVNSCHFWSLYVHS